MQRLPQWLQACWRYLYVALLLCVIAFPAVLVGQFKRQQALPDPLLEELRRDKESFDRFRLQGVTLISSTPDNHRRFTATAEKIVHSNRKARFFAYHNLTELSVSGLRVELYPRPQLEQNATGLLSASFAEISNLCRSLAGPLTTFSEDMLENLDTETELVTRVLIERLAVTVHLQDKTKLTLAAKKALVNLRGVTFQGHFSLISTDGVHFTAPLAIWIQGTEKLYAPYGYSLRSKGAVEKGTEAVFHLERDGTLVKVREESIEGISGADWLDEAEEGINNVILGEVGRSVPALRLFFPQFLAALPLLGSPVVTKEVVHESK